MTSASHPDGYERAPFTFSYGRAVVVAGLVLLLVFAIGPIAYMIVESFRTSTDTAWTLTNWTALFHGFPIVTGIKNSTILAVSASALTVLVTSCAGFAFAKLPFRGSRLVLGTVIMTLAFPLISAIVPEYLDWANHGYVGSYLPPILIYSAFNAAFAIIFFTNYFLSVPDEYIESAITDGASYVTVLFRVVLPMALPAIVTIAVFDFILVWNDLLIALIFLPQGSHQTASVVLATVGAGKVVQTQQMFAGALLSVVPNIVVFLAFQRYLLLGFSLGVDK